ncbi:hypothetical protein SLE2022_121370 [Rubroshorea leprosula]
MASFNTFILTFFMALTFSSMEVGLATRHLQQLLRQPQLSTLPTLPNELPPLPSVPILPQPTIQSSDLPLPSLPDPSSLPLPSLPNRGSVLPPLPSISSSLPKVTQP